ncbi:MAG: helix-turn-helix domain-containing protein [Isosphaeraceae bacterium]
MSDQPKEPEAISESLRKAIAESGLTPYHVAKRARVSPQIITRFLRGERGLSLVVIDRLGQALGLELRRRA